MCVFSGLIEYLMLNLIIDVAESFVLLLGWAFVGVVLYVFRVFFFVSILLFVRLSMLFVVFFFVKRMILLESNEKMCMKVSSAQKCKNIDFNKKIKTSKTL